jgi:hypothetical protein
MVTEVSPDAGNRIVCYCGDCQAFARFLGQPGIVDAQGGTDIFQVAPARMRFTEGVESLRCMRLSDKGLFRFYTECCRTPVANTLSGRVPFAGLIQPLMDHEGDGRSRDEVLGKPIGLVHGRDAIGGVPALAHAGAGVGVLAHCARVMLGWWLAGKGSPSPFFDPRTKAPRAEPQVLGVEERAKVRG